MHASALICTPDRPLPEPPCCKIIPTELRAVYTGSATRCMRPLRFLYRLSIWPGISLIFQPAWASRSSPSLGFRRKIASQTFRRGGLFPIILLRCSISAYSKTPLACSMPRSRITSIVLLVATSTAKSFSARSTRKLAVACSLSFSAMTFSFSAMNFSFSAMDFSLSSRIISTRHLAMIAPPVSSSFWVRKARTGSESPPACPGVADVQTPIILA